MNIQESMNLFCRNISQRRKDAGLSVLELSQRSGLPLEMLQELDKGILPEDMMVDDAIHPSQAFGCKTADLFR